MTFTCSGYLHRLCSSACIIGSAYSDGQLSKWPKDLEGAFDREIKFLVVSLGNLVAVANQLGY